MRILPLIRSLIFLTSISFNSLAQTKHALIFAIGDYPEPKKNGWMPLSSNSDAKLIEATLIKQGFDRKNIRTVSDAAATKEGIINAIKDLKVSKGDIVLIHFSSHGLQIEDDNNKDELDGLDEAIVPYGAVYSYDKDEFAKCQADYFRDDHFGKLMNELRMKLGSQGDVVVIIDACHSGTATRGITTGKIRGGKPALVSGYFNGTNLTKTDGEVQFRDDSGIGSSESGLATYVVFSAARSGESNYETLDDDDNPIGSLTYAIGKAFEKLNENTTYRSLFAKVQVIMNDKVRKQQPVLEGTGVDRALFGGKYVAQKPYIEIKAINVKQITINGGKLLGLDNGSRVAIYPSGTTNPSSSAPLSEGIISGAMMYTSEVTLAKELVIKQPAEGWVFVTEPVFNIDPIAISIADPKGSGVKKSDLPFSPSEIKVIQESIKNFPLFTLKGTPELLLVKGPAVDSLLIMSNGFAFRTLKSAADTVSLKAALRQYAQYKLLSKANDIEDPTIRVDVKFVPVANGRPDTSLIKTKMKNYVYEFTEKDTVKLLVTNNGPQTVFYNILDMQPDGQINPVAPIHSRDLTITPDELKLLPGSSAYLPGYLLFGPPYGIEIFKVFVSTDKLNMEPVATTRGEGTRSGMKALELLLKDSYNLSGTSTRGVSVGAGNANGSCFSVTFSIVKE